MATMDDLIEEILAEYEPRPILNEPPPPPPPPRPLRPQWPFTDLDDRVPHPVRLPDYEPWVEILNDAKDEFEVHGAAAVFSTWRVEEEDPLDIGDVEIADGMHARAGRLALDARMADVRATQLLAALPGGTEFLLRIKFLREKAEDDWVLEKFDPVWAEQKKGRGGGGGRRGRSEHKPWGIDWNRQCVLSERLPHHRNCLWPLPRQGFRSYQPSPVKRW